MLSLVETLGDNFIIGNKRRILKTSLEGKISLNLMIINWVGNVLHLITKLNFLNQLKHNTISVSTINCHDLDLLSRLRLAHTSSTLNNYQIESDLSRWESCEIDQKYKLWCSQTKILKITKVEKNLWTEIFYSDGHETASAPVDPFKYDNISTNWIKPKIPQIWYWIRLLEGKN